MPAAERGRLPRRAALSSVGGCAAIVTVLGGTAALLGHPQGKVQVLRAVPTGLCPPVLVFWLCTALVQAGNTLKPSPGFGRWCCLDKSVSVASAAL